MSFEEFIAKWTGKTVDFDKIYPNQCMDLMHQYVYDVLGLTDARILSHPAAYQVFTDFTETQYFEKIANTPTGVAQKGDIVLFNKTPTNPYGHVCIFIEGDANKFKSFDANFPLNTLPHIQDHTYGYCLGWLHPKQVQPDLQTQLDQIRAERDNHWNTLVGFYNALGTIQDQQVALEEIKKLLTLENLLQDKDKQLNDATNKIKDMELKVKTMETENANLLTDNTKLKKEVENQGETILEQGSKINSLVTEIAEVKKAVLTPVFAGWKRFLVNLISKL